MPTAGEKAPQFTLQDDQRRKVKLSDFRGKKLVLYFYPRDLTPGCTKEACGFRDDLSKLQRKNVEVVGVSTDTVDSHQRFRDTHDLNFRLLSDPDHQVAERYGVWKEKNMYGRKSWGVKRTTFIVDEEGRIAHVFGKVDTASHSKDVLDRLEKLGN
ncbi:MAG TPA: thioredoxin-dependent thiol peroxidase [Blastocatellia bacterium]|nr:thioredoxin-dependent thiol peroxidase [Blastocatellia bacterium]